MNWLSMLADTRFTGKERDVESGLDYFGVRYLNSNLGRWMSSDPTGLALAEAENPQSLNLYSYVRDSPLSFTDPDGLQAVPACYGNGCPHDLPPPPLPHYDDNGGGFIDVGSGPPGGGGGGNGGGWSSTPYPGKNLVNVYYPCGSACIGGHVSVGTYDSEDNNPNDPWFDRQNAYGFTTINQHRYVKPMPIVGWPFFKGWMEPDSRSPRSRVGAQYRYLSIDGEHFKAVNNAITNHSGNYRFWLLPRNCANTVEDIDRIAGAHGVPHHEIFIPHAFWWLFPIGWAK